MKIDDLDQDELLKIWRPQALQKAENGCGVITITQFLRSKGISKEVATKTAHLLVKEGKQINSKVSRPLKVVGWFLVGIGVFITVATLIFGKGFYVVAMGPFVLGVPLVWGDYRRSDD